MILPVVLAAVYSFFNWNGLSALDRFIGFDNYVRALSDPVFQAAIGHNLVIVGLSLAIQGPIAIGVALLLNRRMRGRTVLRLLIFVPFVLSEVIAGLAWKLLLQPHGPFDGVLEALGLGGLRQLWLADQNVVFWTLFVVLSWKYLGFAIILFLAGLQGVPEELCRGGADRRRHRGGRPSATSPSRCSAPPSASGRSCRSSARSSSSTWSGS